jgi:uncharacterized membrane protein YoaK (UPF0700 family)
MLTVVTGLVDGVSYLALGHVFVANMTGNVVLLGFAIVGAAGLSASASLASIGAFMVGALAGGRVGVRYGAHRARHLRAAAAISASLVVIAVIVAAIAGRPVTQGARYELIVLLALAMGMQNATARRLAVPDLTTTVLTLTLTGVAADSHAAGGAGGHPGRRLIAVAAMLAGALISAVLVLNVDLPLPLGIAAVLLVAVALGSHSFAAETSAWTRPPGSG